MAIFRFLKMAAAAILDFENFTLWTVGTVKCAEQRHYDNLCRNSSNRGRDITILGFVKMAAAGIAWILKILNF